jgi:hypothetical protein
MKVPACLGPVGSFGSLPRIPPLAAGGKPRRPMNSRTTSTVSSWRLCTRSMSWLQPSIVVNELGSKSYRDRSYAVPTRKHNCGYRRMGTCKLFTLKLATSEKRGHNRVAKPLSPPTPPLLFFELTAQLHGTHAAVKAFWAHSAPTAPSSSGSFYSHATSDGGPHSPPLACRVPTRWFRGRF